MPGLPVRFAVLAEDDATLRAILRRALEDGGYRVEEASDGAAALEICRRARPDLIVTDILMAGLRGPEFLAQARAEGIDAPALIVSTDIDDAARELVARGPRTAALKKPFPLEEFQRAVAGLTDAPKP